MAEWRFPAIFTEEGDSTYFSHVANATKSALPPTLGSVAPNGAIFGGEACVCTGDRGGSIGMGYAMLLRDVTQSQEPTGLATQLLTTRCAYI